MRIGVQTGGIEERFGFDQTIAMIHEAGFDAIDLNLDHLLSYADIKNHVNSGFFDLSDAEMKAKLAPWKASIEKHGIDVYQAHSPFPCYIGDAATDAYTLHALKKTIMLCGYFGCKNLIVHPAFKPYDEKLDPEEEWRINKEMYMALLPELRQYGVTACLENMFGVHRGKVMSAVCSNPHEAVRYIDELNSIAGEKLFGFCFDIGHATLVGNDPLDVMRILGNRICAFHIHDNDGRSDEHLMPYMGIANWDRFCQGVHEIGYTGVLSLETFNAINIFPQELSMEALRMESAIARQLSEKIQSFQ